MPLKKYWATATTRLRCKFPWTTFDGDVSKWGGSDQSPEDAHRVATRLVEDLAGRVAERRKWPDQYDLYAEGPGLREEILETVPAPNGDDLGLVSRNRYGARVLNTFRVAFVDIDSPDPRQIARQSGWSLLRLFGFGKADPPTPAPTQDPAKLPDMLTEFSRQNPSWGLRVYRTAQGWRVLVTHAQFDPDSSTVLQAMKDMGADPLYIKLCRGQKLFRARLTPKPWRVGCDMPVGIHPRLTPELQQQHREWLRKYEAASVGQGVCQLESHLGPERITDPLIQAVIDYHDKYCLAAPGSRLA